MKVLIIVEHDNQTLAPINLHVLSAAHALGDTIDLFIVGHECSSVVEQTKMLPSVNCILVANHPVYTHQLPENTAKLIIEIAKSYDYILMGSSTFGKNILPRVAALLETEMLSDVMSILSPTLFVRPMYAGNILATIEYDVPIKCLTIRGTGFPAVELGTQKNINVMHIDTVITNSVSRFMNAELTASTRPELTNARIIVSGGRGFKSADNFKSLESLADTLGAAIGASRAAVDAGFAPNDYQVGQTGKVVAPDLYIAIGISGAVQHMAGMKDSKYIVAINNDPDAPIFKLSDYGLLGDLFTILPNLEAEIKKQ